MKYRELFSLNIRHTYYKDGLCPDFLVQPTEDCLTLLRNYQLLYRQTVNGIRVIGGDNVFAKSGTVKSSVVNDLNFRFWLILQNSQFPNFTAALEVGEKSITNPFFARDLNDNEDLVLKPSHYTTIRTEMLIIAGKKPHRYRLKARPTIVNSSDLRHFQIAQPNEKELQVTDFNEDGIVVTIKNSGNEGRSFNLIYEAFSPLPPGVFGLASISRVTEVSQFAINFHAPKLPVNYFLVIDDKEEHEFIIEDGDAGRDQKIEFIEFKEVTTSHSKPDEDDSKSKSKPVKHAREFLTELRGQNPGTKIILLYSKEKFASTEKGVRNLRLMQSRPSTKIILDPLPSPRPTDNGMTVIKLLKPQLTNRI